MGCESLTYEERRAIGWGTVKERLGKVCNEAPSDGLVVRKVSLISYVPPAQDSIKDWDSCALCLHPVQVRALRRPVFPAQPRAARHQRNDQSCLGCRTRCALRRVSSTRRRPSLSASCSRRRTSRSASPCGSSRSRTTSSRRAPSLAPASAERVACFVCCLAAMPWPSALGSARVP